MLPRSSQTLNSSSVRVFRRPLLASQILVPTTFKADLYTIVRSEPSGREGHCLSVYIQGLRTAKMPSQGYVVASDGVSVFVADKWTYFREHPGSFEATLDAKNAIAAKDRLPKPTHRRGTKATCTDTFQYCCLDGYVIKSCTACNMSL